MDVPTTAMTPTQLLIIWTLMGLLLVWMVIFALLAFRPARQKRAEFEDFSASTGSFSQLHMIARQPISQTASVIQREPSSAVEVTSAVIR